MQCHNCPKKAMYTVEPNKVPVCLDCYSRIVANNLAQQEFSARFINYLMDTMDSMVGVHGVTPRIELGARPIVHTGEMKLNNIQVSGSTIGVLNTGTIQNLDNKITTLGQENDAATMAVKNLSNAVIQSKDLSDEQKKQVIEFLDSITDEILAPKNNRKPTVAKALWENLRGILSKVSSLSKFLKDLEKILRPMLGI